MLQDASSHSRSAEDRQARPLPAPDRADATGGRSPHRFFRLDAITVMPKPMRPATDDTLPQRSTAPLDELWRVHHDDLLRGRLRRLGPVDARTPVPDEQLHCLVKSRPLDQEDEVVLGGVAVADGLARAPVQRRTTRKPRRRMVVSVRSGDVSGPAPAAGRLMGVSRQEYRVSER
jgi:hypothetical protein